MIAYRAMEPGDADAVARVEEASFAVPWPRKAFWEEAANEHALYIVALDGETVIGYAGAWILDDEAQVMNVAVAPSHRSMGVGAGLMERLVGGAKRRGAARMTLEVRPSNAAALALYAKFGFKDFGRRPRYYLDNGEDAVIMWNMRL